GTIESYHRVNLLLTEPVPTLNLYDEHYRFFSRPRFLPPAKIGEALVQRAIICDGAIIGDGATVRKSILGIRAVVGPGCNLDRVVHNGAGDYDFGAGHVASNHPSPAVAPAISGRHRRPTLTKIPPIPLGV